VETVVCAKTDHQCEAYALATDEFGSLFSRETAMDRQTFAEMQRVACLTFKMDKASRDARAQWR
jgi:hypothetical protein